MDAAVLEPRTDGVLDQPVLVEPREPLELRRGDDRPQVVAPALVEDLDLGARKRLLDHPLELGEVGHGAILGRNRRLDRVFSEGMAKLTATLAALVMALAAAPAAHATFPGKPGKIAFSRSPVGSASAKADIWIATRSGHQRRLTSGSADDTSPVFSRNGRMIAFVRRSGGDADVWVMRANGTRKHPVADTGVDELQPSFFPGGGSLLYTQFDGSREWTVFSIRLNGTRRKRQASDATFPIVSPNGRLLAYTKTQDGVGGIHLKNLRSERVRRLTTGSAQDLDFSPDGRRIVFTGQRPCRRGGNLRFAVLSVGLHANHADILRRSCRREFISPAWSPNGRRIVFAHKRSAGRAEDLRFRLGMMRPGGGSAGGAPHHHRGTNELGPAWQPRPR